MTLDDVMRTAEAAAAGAARNIPMRLRELRLRIDQYAAEQVAEALAAQKQPRPSSRGQNEAIDRALACLNAGATAVTVQYTDD